MPWLPVSLGHQQHIYWFYGVEFVFVFLKSDSDQPEVVQCWDMLENTNIFLCFIKWIDLSNFIKQHHTEAIRRQWYKTGRALVDKRFCVSTCRLALNVMTCWYVLSLNKCNLYGCYSSCQQGNLCVDMSFIPKCHDISTHIVCRQEH